MQHFYHKASELGTLRQKILDQGNVPRHVAVIMDGNGRWAKQRFKPRVWGHHKGAESVRVAVKTASELGVKVLTLYAFSEENWGRPEHEVEAILALINTYILKERDNLKSNNIRLHVIGNIEKLSAQTRQMLKEAREYLSSGTGLILNIALSYGSRSEITKACRDIASLAQDGSITLGDITPELISSFLSTRDLGDPDLLIRTSGEHRISNFLLWQLAYSELWFSEVYWPDFREKDFYEAVSYYQTRTRRYGLVEEDRSLTSEEKFELEQDIHTTPC